MAKKKMLDNSKYAEQIRKTTWGVDMREPIAKALENQYDVHTTRTVSFQLDPMEDRRIRTKAKIEMSTPQKHYEDHFNRVPNDPDKDCQNASTVFDNFFTLTFNRADQQD